MVRIEHGNLPGQYCPNSADGLAREEAPDRSLVRRRRCHTGGRVGRQAAMAAEPISMKAAAQGPVKASIGRGMLLESKKADSLDR